MSTLSRSTTVTFLWMSDQQGRTPSGWAGPPVGTAVPAYCHARTRATIDEHTFYDLCRQPNNPDIAWVQERTTNPKPTE
jgi:hypothetical protein